MPHKEVVPVLEPSIRGLCVRPYPGHKKGCPNFGKREYCPPQAPLLPLVFDLHRPVIAVWNRFDLAAHVGRLQVKHPEWSWRQLVCCLYWQGTARRALEGEIKVALPQGNIGVLRCPEACGVNVTATMASIGVVLEWPPKTVTYQVALVGQRGPTKEVEQDG